MALFAAESRGGFRHVNVADGNGHLYQEDRLDPKVRERYGDEILSRVADPGLTQLTQGDTLKAAALGEPRGNPEDTSHGI